MAHLMDAAGINRGGDGLREAMARASAATAAREAGLGAVTIEFSGDKPASTRPMPSPGAVPITPTLNSIADELDRLHDRLADLHERALELAEALDSGRVERAMSSADPQGPRHDGVVGRMAERVGELHRLLSMAQGHLASAAASI